MSGTGLEGISHAMPDLFSNQANSFPFGNGTVALFRKRDISIAGSPRC
jgi:hypothetical protein